MNEYIAVSEFAKRAGVSRQAVYKKLNNGLNSFVKVVDGKKLINTEALDTFKTTPVVQHDDNLLRLVDYLKRTNSLLEKELEIKNSQIEALISQNTALTARLQESNVLLAQAQAPAIETKKGFFSRFRRVKQDS